MVGVQANTAKVVSSEQDVPLQVKSPKSAEAKLSGLIALTVISCPESVK